MSRTLLIYFGLGILEATPPALLLAFWGAPGALIPIALVVLGAALADVAVQRLFPPRRQRAALVIVVLALALWATQSIVLGRMSLVGGWGAFFAALAEPTGSQGTWALLVLAIVLYAAWRGVRLSLYQDEGVRELFARSMLSLLGVLLFGNFTSTLDDPRLPAVVTGEIVIAFSIGLTTIALTRHLETDVAVRPPAWRDLAPVLAAIVIILLVGAVVGGMLGSGAAEALLGALALLLTAIGVALLPVLLLFLSMLAWLMEQLHVERAMLALQELARALQQNGLQQRPPLDDPLRMVPWLGPLLEWGLRIAPIVVLLVAIYAMMQRRSGRSRSGDEERESVFSWESLFDDLRSLFGNSRGDDTSLRAALARLTGNDPASRVRRSYIRMLIAAEERKFPRLAAQTPQEYEPQAQQAFPGAAQPLGILTHSYERARYHPQAVSDTDARAAEEALGRISKPD